MQMAAYRLLLLPIALSGAVALAQPGGSPPLPLVRVGREFQVNSFTSSAQYRADVAMNDAGAFVVAWNSLSQDNTLLGIFAERFDSAGVPQATEFLVNRYTESDESRPSVAIDDQGEFVITWMGRNDGYDLGVFARRYDSLGTPLAVEFRVNTFTVGSQLYPAVAMDDDGDFVVAWNGPDGGLVGVFARRFDSTGAPQAVEFQANVFITARQRHPDIAMDVDGDFVMVWQGEVQDGSGYGVFARRASAAGVALATEFQVNIATSSQQYQPRVAMDPDGAFVVVWTAFDGVGLGILARRYDAAGSPLTGEFVVNTRVSLGQYTPGIDMSAGGFVVAWGSYFQDGANAGVFARQFDAAGVALAREFQVNSFTIRDQQKPRVAVNDDIDVVVVWESVGNQFFPSQDDSASGVFGQRYRLAALLDADANGATGALTDGLVILRYLFGFGGDSLIGGAIGPDCSLRCDASSIGAYLDSIVQFLDVDDDGQSKPLTDGLLILRYLFGFRGDTLIAGAVGPGCDQRCTAPAIEVYLAGLV
jgi:hypothetical protein